MSARGEDLIPFLIEATDEIPRKATWSYLIRPARDESATSILKSRSKDEEENHWPQMSPQGVAFAARAIAHGGGVKQYVASASTPASPSPTSSGAPACGKTV